MKYYLFEVRGEKQKRTKILFIAFLNWPWYPWQQTYKIIPFDSSIHVVDISPLECNLNFQLLLKLYCNQNCWVASILKWQYVDKQIFTLENYSKFWHPTCNPTFYFKVKNWKLQRTLLAQLGITLGSLELYQSKVCSKYVH